MKNIAKLLNVLVIMASVAIIVMMSIEVLAPDKTIKYSTIVHFHFAICMIFLADYVVRLLEAPNKWRFAWHNILFLLISVPYLSIMQWSGVELTKETELVIRYVPFIRAAYGFAIVLGYFTRSKITNLFFTYIVVILSTAYFASLVFYSVEKGVNVGITTYHDALWWAFMDLTTVGSNINAVTGIGRILAVVLAASGMMMFPIFTAFITSRFSNIFDRTLPPDVETPAQK